MMRSRMVGSVVLFGAMAIASLVAHHSVTRVYDERETITIVGTVERIVDRMPHPSVELVVIRQGAIARTWAVEFDAARRLTGPASEPPLLLPGDLLTVCGNPGRDPGEYRLRMLALERPDGLSLRSPVSLAEMQCLG